MEIVAVIMPLVKRDEQLLQIEELIEAKRRMLLDKQKKKLDLYQSKISF